MIKKVCIAAVGSVTAAIKGEKLLDDHGISSEIVKVDPSMTERGCAYGLKFPCGRSGAAESILRQAKMEYKIITL